MQTRPAITAKIESSILLIYTVAKAMGLLKQQACSVAMAQLTRARECILQEATRTALSFALPHVARSQQPAEHSAC